MIKLRPYQQAVLDAVRRSIATQGPEGASVVIESPTGSGKTAMAAFIAESTLSKGGSLAFICHRQELIDQTALTFDQVGIPYAFIANGYPRQPSRVKICSVGTLVRRAAKIPPPTVVVWDECHHLGARTWSKVHAAWARSTHVGLSATPQRLDGTGLHRWFSEIVHGPPVATLIEQGYLSRYRAYAPTVPDISGVHQRAGEYRRRELELAVGQGEILGDIAGHWQRLAPGRKTIAFAVSVKHSAGIVEAFRAAGVSAAHLDAKTPKPERRHTLQRFARGEIEVLSNVELFGEGFDLAANAGLDCTVEGVILARPTMSVGLHLQQVGRALRPKDEPAVILDHAGNCVRHGLPDEPRTWSLEDRPKGEGEGREVPCTVRMCGECYAVVSIDCTHCPYCGAVLPVKGRAVKELEGDLQEIDQAEMLEARRRRRSRQEVGRAQSLEALRELAKARGYRPGWAEHVWRGRQGQSYSRRR